MQGIARGGKTNLSATFSYELLYMDAPVLAEKHRIRYIISVKTLNVI